MSEIKPFDYSQQGLDSVLFPAGEEAALQRLRVFVASMFRIMLSSEIFRLLMEPVFFPPI